MLKLLGVHQKYFKTIWIFRRNLHERTLLHLFRRNFKKLKDKSKKCKCEMNVNSLNLVFNFLKLPLKRCNFILLFSCNVTHLYDQTDVIWSHQMPRFPPFSSWTYTPIFSVALIPLFSLAIVSEETRCVNYHANIFFQLLNRSWSKDYYGLQTPWAPVVYNFLTLQLIGFNFSPESFQLNPRTPGGGIGSDSPSVFLE